MRLLVCLGLTIASSAAFAALALSVIKPTYRSEFVLLVSEPHRAENEAALLRSDALAGAVVSQLALAHDSEFNPDLEKIEGSDRSTMPAIDSADPAAALVQTLPDGFKSLSLDLPGAAPSNNQTSAVHEKLSEKVVIEVVPDSSLIKAAVLSRDPAKAVAIAQSYINAYLTSEDAPAAAPELLPEGYTLDKAQKDKDTLQERLDHPQKLVSPLIVTLAEERKKLMAYIERMSQRYKEKHPKMVEAQQTLNKMDSMVRSEQAVLRKAVERDIALTERRIALLQAGPGAEMSQQEAQQKNSPRASLMSGPTVPGAPYCPDKKRWMLLSVLIGAGLGLGYYALTYRRSRSVHRSSDLENIGAKPVIAALPLVRPPRHYSVADAILAPEEETAAQAVRALSVVLSMKLAQASGKKKEGKLVTITSAYPGEGKTILALWLGRIAAQKDLKVVLVDADLRQDGLYRLMEYADDAYLADALGKTKDLKKALYKDPETPLKILFSRPHSDHQTIDTLTSPAFDDLVSALKKDFDLVIFDSPATLAAPDARALSALSDLTLFAVAWRSTPLDMIKAGLKQFENLGYENLAFVLTKVKVPHLTQDMANPDETGSEPA